MSSSPCDTTVALPKPVVLVNNETSSPLALTSGENSMTNIFNSIWDPPTQVIPLPPPAALMVEVGVQTNPATMTDVAIQHQPVTEEMGIQTNPRNLPRKPRVVKRKIVHTLSSGMVDSIIIYNITGLTYIFR